MEQSNVSIGATSAVVIDHSPTGEISYCLIQNTHASQDLYIRLDGATVTTANGVKIAAGKAYEHHFRTPIKNDITGIASGASTTAITTHE